MRAGLTISLAAALLLLNPGNSLPAGAEDDSAGDLLERMISVSEGTSYIGRKHVFQFSRGLGVREYEILHKSNRMERKRCIRGEKEEGEVIVKDGHYTWHYMPLRRRVIRRSIGGGMETGAFLKRDVGLIKRNYTIKLVKKGVTLAGRSASVLEFVPKAEGKRPVRRIWMDDEKGVALRTDVFGLDREMALMSCFTEIRFRPDIGDEDFILKVPKGTLVESIQEKSFRKIEDILSSTRFRVLTPDYLPLGFVAVGGRVHHYPGFEEVQLQFSDGLSPISLFQDNRGGEQGAVLEEMKNTNPAQTVRVGKGPGYLYDLGLLRLLKWKKGDISFTLVSELEVGEMLKIAESLK